MTSDNLTLQRERLMADLRSVIADAEGLVKAGGAEAGDAAEEARGKLQDRLTQLKDKLTYLQEEALLHSKAVGRAADNYVHEHPWQAMGAAAGVGLLLGLLISRR
jgi:ElaB/YqjD/DUF883 family membrane-anchored ribosome-binding protein